MRKNVPFILFVVILSFAGHNAAAQPVNSIDEVIPIVKWLRKIFKAGGPHVPQAPVPPSTSIKFGEVTSNARSAMEDASDILDLTDDVIDIISPEYKDRLVQKFSSCYVKYVQQNRRSPSDEEVREFARDYTTSNVDLENLLVETHQMPDFGQTFQQPSQLKIPLGTRFQMFFRCNFPI